jgi:hypothetical protein
MRERERRERKTEREKGYKQGRKKSNYPYLQMI